MRAFCFSQWQHSYNIIWCMHCVKKYSYESMKAMDDGSNLKALAINAYIWGMWVCIFVSVGANYVALYSRHNTRLDKDRPRRAGKWARERERGLLTEPGLLVSLHLNSQAKVCQLHCSSLHLTGQQQVLGLGHTHTHTHTHNKSFMHH